MILDSSFEKEFSKHIIFCREEFFISTRGRNKPTKSIKGVGVRVQEARDSEYMYKEKYVSYAEKTKHKIIEKFKESNLSHRLHIINSFYSEFWKIGFSWKTELEEIIIFFTFNDDDEIYYECHKSDYSQYVKNEYTSCVTTITTPFPAWFINALKTN